MRCPNCKKFIINPVEHEFCVFSSKPAPRIEQIIGLVIKPDEYVAPKVQGKLNHQVAKPGAKPPPTLLVKKVQGNPVYADDEGEEDGYTALKRKLAEG